MSHRNLSAALTTGQVIQSIDISDFELVMTEQSEAFSPATSSKHVLVQFKNPFGFSLQVVQSSVNMTLSTQGIDAAEVCSANPYLILSETDFLLQACPATDCRQWWRLHRGRSATCPLLRKSTPSLFEQRCFLSILQNRHHLTKRRAPTKRLHRCRRPYFYRRRSHLGYLYQRSDYHGRTQFLRPRCLVEQFRHFWGWAGQ